MPNTGTRQAKRTPVTLKIKFKSATLDQFIERYSVDVSHGGIFIRTKDPLAVGTTLKFEFQLKDASPLIRGEGTVVWTREHDPARAGVAPGMGVRFDRLPPESQEVLDQILTQKAAKGGGKGRKPSNTAQQFGDVPTRVAPSPLVAGLKSASAEVPKDDKVMGLAPPAGGFGGEGERTDATPLPTPMPFHSDADDFPEEAFEEATRVAALNPALVAQTAREDGGDDEELFSSDSGKLPGTPTVDEIAEKRAEKERAAREAKEAEEKRAAEAEAKAEAEKQARAEKEKAEQEKAEQEKAAKAEAAKQKAAEEKADKAKAKAKADKAKADKEKQVAAAAAAAEEAPPERRSSGSILALAAAAIVILGVGAYVVFGMGKDDKGKKTDQVANTDTPDTPTPEPAPAVDPTPEPEPEPPAEMVEFELAAPAGATVSLVDGDQSGEVPFTFNIEKDKPTEVRVSKEGFVAQVVTIESGKPAPKIKLEPKPRVVTVDSTPSGAAVAINGRRMPGATPMDVELSGALARARSIKVTVTKAGFQTGRTSFVSASAPWTDAGDAMKHSVSVELKQRSAVAVKKAPVKKDEPKKVVKKDEPKKDEPVKVVKKDEPKKDEPKKDEPKKDEPKEDEGPTPDWMK